MQARRKISELVRVYKAVCIHNGLRYTYSDTLEIFLLIIRFSLESVRIT